MFSSEINLNRQKLLILGGSALSSEIVHAAKSMGVYTIVTDWYPVDKSPAKSIADEYHMISTADVAAIVDLINKENIDGVLTGFTDSTLTFYQQICEKASKPCYLTQGQIEFTTNKIKFKSLCKSFAVPVVDEYLITDETIEQQVSLLNFPVIVKPVDNSGARGISICNSKEEFIESYKKAIQFSESKKVIVERYMTCEEVTIFYVLRNGELYLTAMGNRHTKHNQKGVIPLPVAYTFPSQYLPKYQETLNHKVIKMFQSIGMKDGMIFIQSFVENGECIFYEMGYRLTGSLEYKILEVVSGFNPLKMMIQFALTGDMGNQSLLSNSNPNFNKHAFNITFLGKPGRIKEIIGINDILNIPGVIDAFPTYRVGDTILESFRGTLLQVVLRVFAAATTKKELAEIMNRVHSVFRVIDVDGGDMLLDKFDVNSFYYE